MKEMKRILSLVLALVLVVGLLPATAFATEVDTDYLFFGTDRHGDGSIIANLINEMEADVGENKLEYLGLGGDMVGSGTNHPSYNSSTVLAEVTGATSSLTATNVDLVAGVHDVACTDDAGILLPYGGGSGLRYTGDKYYVYGVEEYSISEDYKYSDNANPTHTVPSYDNYNDKVEEYISVQAQKFVDWANGADIDKSKVIIVLSHYPLHAKRNDNDGAYNWHQALNTVATGAASGDATVERDVVFFHGHNHTQDKTEYVYNVGDTMSIQNGSSTKSETIYYTYATAGYLSQDRGNGQATLMAITDKKVTLTKYSSSKSSAMTEVDRVVQETEPEITEQTWYDNETSPWAAVTATAENGTVADVYDENNTVVNELLSFWYGYNFSLEGQVADTDATVTLWLEPEFMTSENLAVYYLNETTGKYEPVTGYAVAKDDAEVEYITIEKAAMGTYVYGTPAEEVVEIPEGATLKGIYITGAAEKTKYFDTDTRVITDENGEEQTVIAIDITGLTVTAKYVLDGEEYTKTVQWNEFDSNADGYALTHDPLIVDDAVQFGKKTVTLTYSGKTAQYSIWVCKTGVEIGDISITFDAPSVLDVVVEKAAEVAETITNALAEKLEGNLAVYDITAQYVEGENKLSGKASVTLPLPEGITKPAVFYVSDDGSEIEKMSVTGKDLTAGTVTFTTDHFSKFVVGDSTELVVDDPNEEYVSGTTTTKKTVYVLSSSISSGKSYLIVNGNTAGDGYYALKNNSGTVDATDVTIKSDSTIGTYIELDDATDELWTTSGSNSTTLKNGSHYLRYNSGLGLSANNSTTWSYSSNRLSYYSNSNRTTNYLRYNSGWTTTSQSNNATSIYFYVPTEVEVETTVNGTYSIAGNPEEVKMVTSNGSETTLDYTITFTPVSGSATTVTNLGGTVTFSKVEDGDPNGVITSLNASTGEVVFSGTTGTALVKVSYTWTANNTTYTIDNYITVEATGAYNTIQAHEGSNTAEALETLAVKGVTNSTTKELSTVVTAYTTQNPTGAAVSNPSVTWSVVSGAEIFDKDAAFTLNGTTAATVTGSGNVTLNFSGEGGMAVIRAKYDDNTFVDISVTASKESYYVPEDGTDDFPDYPEPGAVVLDKTASAIGDFNKTGIAQVELNMFGVPVSQAKPFDVVLMLDLSNSMQNNSRTTYLIEAAKAFVETICLDSSGNWNKLEHGISVCSYNIDPENEYPANTTEAYTDDMVDITSKAMVTAACDAIDGLTRAGGTDYAEALKHAYEILKANKDPNRAQYLIFMSDGAPTSYAYIASAKGTDSTLGVDSQHTHSELASGVYTKDGTTYNAYLIDQGTSTGSERELTTSALKNYDEYYTYMMKQAGVNIHTVGLAITDTNDQAVMTNLASASTQAYFISDGDSTGLTNAFVTMGEGMMEAASNVQVNDKIADEYTMIFDLPENIASSNLPENQEFYIEVINYTLDSTDSDGDGDKHERTGSTTEMKVYLAKDGSGNYYAASDDDGTQYATPVFGDTAQGTMYYWTTTNISTEDDYSGVSLTVDGTTYYFVAEGKDSEDDDWDTVSSLWFNMESGAFASGTTDAKTGTSDNIIIATPYFVYNAATRILTWTTDKLGNTNQIAIRYFLYLDESAGTEPANQVAAGPYPTNDWATLSYVNHNGNECKKYFPVPQQTWNGAQVGYTFYLVNTEGQPINRSGKVVDFTAATFVTNTFYEAITWNDPNAAESLEANIVAGEKLPEQYTLYDPTATYKVHVYENASGVMLDNFFIIDGAAEGTTTSAGHVMKNDNTTKVYNSINSNRIDAYGTYSGTAALNATINYTEDGVNKTTKVTVNTGSEIDYASTTVAFAVLWIPTLVEDTIVVDYGLPVAINVVANDQLDNTINTLGTTIKDTSVQMNTGVSSKSVLGTGDGAKLENNTLTLKDGNRVVNYNGTLYFVQNDMEFDKPSQFYYDSAVAYTQGESAKTGYMYSKVTVIPATTVYFEDSFVSFSSYSKNATTGTYELDSNEATYGKDGKWIDDGTAKTNAVQSTDRPGVDKFGLTGYDADNNYGYDELYDDCTIHSLGSAKKITVDANTRGEATFTFYGTGFDIIGLTSNTTGTLMLQVYEGAAVDNTKKVKSTIVDTYYGYKKVDGKWVVDNSAENSLYQVPVMEISGLPYKQYTAKLTAGYNTAFDHVTGSTSYDLYLDAVRIYDPTGNADETANKAYVADGEGWPSYLELRDHIISAEDFDTSTSSKDGSGAIFIDQAAGTYSIAVYKNYGPNNELYLAAGQAVTFKLNLPATVDSNGKSIVADVQIGLKSADGKTVTYKAYDAVETTAANATAKTLSTATDMYYSIKDLASGTVVITNTGSSGILSITNIKTTYTTNPNGVVTTGLEWNREVGETALFSLAESSEDVVLNLGNITREETYENGETETQEEAPAVTEPQAEAPKATEPVATEPQVETSQDESFAVTEELTMSRPATYEEAEEEAPEAEVVVEEEPVEEPVEEAESRETGFSLKAIFQRIKDALSMLLSHLFR